MPSSLWQVLGASLRPPGLFIGWEPLVSRGSPSGSSSRRAPVCWIHPSPTRGSRHVLMSRGKASTAGGLPTYLYPRRSRPAPPANPGVGDARLRSQATRRFTRTKPTTGCPYLRGQGVQPQNDLATTPTHVLQCCPMTTDVRPTWPQRQHPHGEGGWGENWLIIKPLSQNGDRSHFGSDRAP